MLECRDVNFSFGNKKILRDISFKLDCGSIVGLFGENGSGKSTLLKILGASYPLKTGAYNVLGANALDAKGYLKPSLRYLYGVLFQEFSSDEKISVQDNLDYAARMMGVGRASIGQCTEKTLELAELKDLACAKVKTLSGGMRRRLELYRTFIHEPKIILLDEPTSGLDHRQSTRFFDFLRAYQKKHGALIIFSTHRAREHEHCDLVLMINEGKIIAKDSPANFLGRLDFMTCKFGFSDAEKKLALQNAGVSLFSRQVDDSNQGLSFSAHIEQSKLAEFLSSQSQLLRELNSFSMSKPNLNDAFNELVAQEGGDA